ncbi:hypothetical protein MLD38_018005 [Melastoma candidum]|uniref:Uncharacterized protein n=1 Tax=Melastoma candidum TaxID=119954 RepID=A0ACB9QSH9_9MYRT|nr:hypothetical protein MLD38_018005 [Melastoma candidum]
MFITGENRQTSYQAGNWSKMTVGTFFACSTATGNDRQEPSPYCLLKPVSGLVTWDSYWGTEHISDLVAMAFLPVGNQPLTSQTCGHRWAVQEGERQSEREPTELGALDRSESGQPQGKGPFKESERLSEYSLVLPCRES